MRRMLLSVPCVLAVILLSCSPRPLSDAQAKSTAEAWMASLKWPHEEENTWFVPARDRRLAIRQFGPLIQDTPNRYRAQAKVAETFEDPELDFPAPGVHRVVRWKHVENEADWQFVFEREAKGGWLMTPPSDIGKWHSDVSVWEVGARREADAR